MNTPHKIAAKKSELTLNPSFKIADSFLDIKSMDGKTITNYLDEQIKRRELSVEKRVKLI